MTMKRFAFVGLLFVLALMFAGCGGNVSEKLHGFWKSETLDSSTGKPFVVVLTKDALTFKGTTTPIVYKSVAVSVAILDASSQAAIFTASRIEKDSARLEGEAFGGTLQFVRISESEARELMQ